MSFDCVLAAWRLHEREVLSFLRGRSGDRDLAEDLLQEVFLKALRQGHGFCELKNPRAWLFRVARTTLIDHGRGKRIGHELPGDLAEPPQDTPRPVDELTDCLARNVPRLRDQDREILQACDLGGRTVRTFAEESGIGLTAAKSRLLRARRRLRELLVENCNVQFDRSGTICCHSPGDST